MSGSKFNMAAALRSGYLFVGREWRYLVRFSLLPIGVSLIVDLALYFQKREPQSFFEDFLWNLPAVALAGWFMFLEARLLLLGERAGHLPSDGAYLAERRQSMSACVMVWILFNMATTTLWGYLVWGMNQKNPVVNFFWLFLVGGGIWGIRFAVAHLLAAVGYPIRRYIFQVNGVAISLRLAALYLLASLPVGLVEFGFLSMILPEDTGGAPDFTSLMNLPQNLAVTAIVMQKIADLISAALTTAAFCYALKEMLGRSARERTA